LEEETGQSLITEEEVDLIHQFWSEEIAGHSKSRTMSVREIVKDK